MLFCWLVRFFFEPKYISSEQLLFYQKSRLVFVFVSFNVRAFSDHEFCFRQFIFISFYVCFQLFMQILGLFLQWMGFFPFLYKTKEGSSWFA